MTKGLGVWWLFAVTAVPFSMAFLLAPCASADGVPTVPAGPDPNIITFANSAQTCGGAVMCSTNGTTGYLINGSGTAFNLSTISQWFQIDVGMPPTSSLPGQPVEPDGGAGGFRVLNDTGATITSFSITINNTFTSGTASVGPCMGLQAGNPVGCDNFQANKGNLGGTTETLSGPGIDSCTSSTSSAFQSCIDNAGGVAANFAPGTVTYTWNGLNIGAGDVFDITFASWNNSASAVNAPEPSSLGMLATGLFGLMGLVRRKLILPRP